MVDAEKILSIIDKTCGNNLLQIRTTDFKKRPENTPDEFEYAKICNQIKKETNIGSQDALRKNLFVDLNRMGFLDRFDKNKKIIEPYRKSRTLYVMVSSKGKEFIRAKNLREKYFFFSAGLNRLFGNFNLLKILFDLLSGEKYDLEYISIYEFIYFVSAVDINSDFSINTQECFNLIKEFRDLGHIQARSVTQKLTSDMNPENYLGNKINKRDFHNWKNEAQQIFGLLNTTVYFEVRNNIKLVLNTGPNSFSEETKEKRLSRSLNQKTLYFLKHDTNKEIGFELHHVVPLFMSENMIHFKLLDDWKNMVYIDGYSHAQISQKNNKNIILEIKSGNVILSDYDNSKIILQNEKNIIYKLSNGKIMEEYNSELIKSMK